MSAALAERERRTAARTLLVAASARRGLSVLLGVGVLAVCASVLFLPWPPGPQCAVLAVIAVNVVLLRRLCGALHSCASASLRELPARTPDAPQ